ncbi:MAG: methionyl-tRNA formyltransferase [Candidatus Saganbacteria bacterium]|nr:methionyl-tRNA formyltransferase [Candidatus Saganbacteria bacterium]
MKLVFFGTPGPAAGILKILLDAKQDIAAVVTQPDRPKGRGRKVSFSSVKEIALKSGLPLEQPDSVKNNPAFKAYLSSLKPDLGVVVAYGRILPQEILGVPKHGFINVHASLLPKYRGAAPIQWALLNGEKETGVTIFKLVEALDAGPVLASQAVPIEDEDNAETLTKKLFDVAGPLLTKTLREIETGADKYLTQDEAQATFAPTLTKESGEIDWRKPAAEIRDRIRALVEWPVAHTFFRGRRLKIFKAELQLLDLVAREKRPGEIIELVRNEGILVATGRGDLLLSEVQLEGKKRIKAYDLVIGHDVKNGEILPN